MLRDDAEAVGCRLLADQDRGDAHVRRLSDDLGGRVSSRVRGQAVRRRERAEDIRARLEPSYDDTLLPQGAALSTAQVRALLARELEPRNEVVVMVGDRASVTKAFADAGIDGVKLVEPDYK